MKIDKHKISVIRHLSNESIAFVSSVRPVCLSFNDSEVGDIFSGVARQVDLVSGIHYLDGARPLDAKKKLIVLVALSSVNCPSVEPC